MFKLSSSTSDFFTEINSKRYGKEFKVPWNHCLNCKTDSSLKIEWGFNTFEFEYEKVIFYFYDVLRCEKCKRLSLRAVNTTQEPGFYLLRLISEEEVLALAIWRMSIFIFTLVHYILSTDSVDKIKDSMKIPMEFKVEFSYLDPLYLEVVDKIRKDGKVYLRGERLESYLEISKEDLEIMKVANDILKTLEGYGRRRRRIQV